MNVPEELRPFLTCMKCNKIYTDPVKLPCTHLFCRHCIIDGDQVDVVRDTCSQCKVMFDIDPNEELPSDPQMQSLLHKYNPSKMENNVFKVCNPDHSRELFCMGHKMEICNSCFTFKHDRCEIRPLGCRKKDMVTAYAEQVPTMLESLEKQQEELVESKNRLDKIVEKARTTIDLGKKVDVKKLKKWMVDGQMDKSDDVDQFVIFVQDYQRLKNHKVEVTEGDVNDTTIRFNLKDVSKMDPKRHYDSSIVLMKGVKWRLTVKLDPLPKQLVKQRGIPAEELWLGIYLNAAHNHFKSGEKYSVEHEMKLVRKSEHGGDEIRTHVNEFPASNGAMISGWPDFVSYKDLCDAKNSWLKEDTLEIICEFKVNPKPIQENQIEKKKETKKSPEDKEDDSDDSDDDFISKMAARMAALHMARIMAGASTND